MLLTTSVRASSQFGLLRFNIHDKFVVHQSTDLTMRYSWKLFFEDSKQQLFWVRCIEFGFWVRCQADDLNSPQDAAQNHLGFVWSGGCTYGHRETLFANYRILK